MQLHDSGLIPTLTHSSLFPSRQAVAEFWGGRYNSSYAFDDHGSPAYEFYVKELYVRVLQQNWPINNMMNFHFARALCAEAMGLEINWAEYGFKATHPHQSRTGIPRLLPQFEMLPEPLPPLVKVLPGCLAVKVRLISVSFNSVEWCSHGPYLRNCLA